MPKKPDYASLYTLRKDGRYVGSYTDSSGRHFVYDRDPERLWHKLNDPKEPKRITFRQIAEDWQAKHWERVGFKTAEAYTAPLRRLIETYGDMAANEVSAQAIFAYLSELGKQGYSQRSVQMHRDILNMIFNEAIMSGVLSVNPCAAVSMPRNLGTTKRDLPEDDVIAAVKAGGSEPFGLFALICLYAGLRRGEALALHYEDIDRKQGVIHVTKELFKNNL